MLRFTCPSCGKTSEKVPERLAGKSVRCPRCKTVAKVPKTAHRVGESEDPDEPEEESFEDSEEIPARPPSRRAEAAVAVAEAPPPSPPPEDSEEGEDDSAPPEDSDEVDDRRSPPPDEDSEEIPPEDSEEIPPEDSDEDATVSVSASAVAARRTPGDDVAAGSEPLEDSPAGGDETPEPQPTPKRLGKKGGLAKMPFAKKKVGLGLKKGAVLGKKAGLGEKKAAAKKPVLAPRKKTVPARKAIAPRAAAKDEGGGAPAPAPRPRPSVGASAPAAMVTGGSEQGLLTYAKFFWMLCMVAAGLAALLGIVSLGVGFYSGKGVGILFGLLQLTMLYLVAGLFFAFGRYCRESSEALARAAQTHRDILEKLETLPKAAAAAAISTADTPEPTPAMKRASERLEMPPRPISDVPTPDSDIGDDEEDDDSLEDESVEGEAPPRREKAGVASEASDDLELEKPADSKIETDVD